ncbi:MAG: hypothetical protein HRT89_13355 [Lentisphaeria bacterium]|nr:hypothetical protein [Lentisphaeria bacterium]NQZ69044.1 hypothetical protein [Lentisphaeria bacterium]
MRTRQLMYMSRKTGTNSSFTTIGWVEASEISNVLYYKDKVFKPLIGNDCNYFDGASGNHYTLRPCNKNDKTCTQTDHIDDDARLEFERRNKVQTTLSKRLSRIS